ncbi:hypothetical protein FRAHR75_770008 [Frankia sp. Hr75.2]|nr:hypothetical protein FRAHR75_770008 [Frankia sp. Hr75.2]
MGPLDEHHPHVSGDVEFAALIRRRRPRADLLGDTVDVHAEGVEPRDNASRPSGALRLLYGRAANERERLPARRGLDRTPVRAEQVRGPHDVIASSDSESSRGRLVGPDPMRLPCPVRLCALASSVAGERGRLTDGLPPVTGGPPFFDDRPAADERTERRAPVEEADRDKLPESLADGRPGRPVLLRDVGLGRELGAFRELAGFDLTAQVIGDPAVDARALLGAHAMTVSGMVKTVPPMDRRHSSEQLY